MRHLQLFSSARSGHGPSRVQCLTHDTKRALVQTMHGQVAICKQLLTSGFKYVLLRELQSDRLEGEFSVYRQATGGNMFMTSSDVCASYKKRLTLFAARVLQSIESVVDSPHMCVGSMESEDGLLVESSLAKITLTSNEVSACT